MMPKASIAAQIHAMRRLAPKPEGAVDGSLWPLDIFISMAAFRERRAPEILGPSDVALIAPAQTEPVAARGSPNVDGISRFHCCVRAQAIIAQLSWCLPTTGRA